MACSRVNFTFTFKGLHEVFKHSHTEDSERRVIEGSGKGTFLFYRGSIGNLKVFSKGSSANMFIGPEHVLYIYIFFFFLLCIT
jgi:hypothetical protein